MASFSSYRPDSQPHPLDHPFWVRFRRCQLFDTALVQPDSRPGYAAVGVRIVGCWVVLISDL